MNKQSQRNTGGRVLAALLVVGAVMMPVVSHAENFRVCKNKVGKTYITKANMDCPEEYSAEMDVHKTGPVKNSETTSPADKPVVVSKSSAVVEKTAVEKTAVEKPVVQTTPVAVTKPEAVAEPKVVAKPEPATKPEPAAKKEPATKPAAASVAPTPVAPTPVAEKPVDPAAVADSVAGRALFDKADYAGALPLLQKAAAGGDHDAQFALGKMYAYGRGVDRDYTEAYKWHTLAGALGDRERQVLEKIMSDADIAEGKKRAQAAQQ